MRKTLTTLAAALLLLGMVLPAGIEAAPSSPFVIDVDPGATQFEMLDQHFLVICTQPLRIMFQGISETRVHGAIISRDDEVLNQVKLIWLDYQNAPLTLADDAIATHVFLFDSEEVTGHNEKIW